MQKDLNHYPAWDHVSHSFTHQSFEHFRSFSVYSFSVLKRRREGYPTTHTIPLFFFVVKAARVTRVGGLPHLRARSYPGRRVNFCHCQHSKGRVKTPTRIKILIVFGPFACNRAFICPRLQCYPTCGILLVHRGYLLPIS